MALQHPSYIRQIATAAVINRMQQYGPGSLQLGVDQTFNPILVTVPLPLVAPVDGVADFGQVSGVLMSAAGIPATARLIDARGTEIVRATVSLDGQGGDLIISVSPVRDTDSLVVTALSYSALRA